MRLTRRQRGSACRCSEIQFRFLEARNEKRATDVLVAVRSSRTLLCGDVWFGALGAESSRKHRRRGDWSRWQCHSECNDFGKQSGVATYKVDHHDRFTRRLQVSKSTVLRLVKAPQLSGWGRLVSSRARW